MSEQRPSNTVIVYDIMELQNKIWEIRHEFDNLGSLAKWLPEIKEWQSTLRRALAQADTELWRMQKSLGFSEEVLIAMREDTIESETGAMNE